MSGPSCRAICELSKFHYPGAKLIVKNGTKVGMVSFPRISRIVVTEASFAPLQYTAPCQLWQVSCTPLYSSLRNLILYPLLCIAYETQDKKGSRDTGDPEVSPVRQIACGLLSHWKRWDPLDDEHLRGEFASPR